MAAIMTKRGSQDNVITYEFMCESAEDMASIDRKYITLGSICIVVNDGAMDIYIADSAHEWYSLSIGANGGGSGDAGASLSIYICANNEVSNGLPNISEPDENTIYLVASGNTSGNLYEEYVYVNNVWEKFGAASIDLSNYATKSELPDMSLYAPKANPVFTGNISMGRSGRTGTGSTALGHNVEASSDYSHAEGYDTEASGYYGAHAEGYDTEASGDYGSHAEGYQSESSGGYGSHAEGYNTEAYRSCSHAEGNDTHAFGIGSHVEGHTTYAYGDYAHTEGSSTFANERYSHAEGIGCKTYGEGSHAEGYSSNAIGQYSHSGGTGTCANGPDSYVFGTFNKPDTQGENESEYPNWTANTTYSINTKIKNFSVIDNLGFYQYYICKHKHTTNSTFDEENYFQVHTKHIEIVGNGTDNNSRSNARALDWNGNEYLKGNLYVNCNADSTGGTQVVTETSLNTLLQPLLTRITALETRVSDLEAILEIVAPEISLTENGEIITDESGNTIEYDI